MIRFTAILSLLLSCSLLLSACGEKENPGGNGNWTPKPGSSDLLNFTGKAEPLECGRNLVAHFIETPQSNWGRTDAGKKPSSLITYPDVCAYLGAFWFLEAAIDNAILTGDDEAKQEAITLMQGMVDKYDDVIKGRTTYPASSGEVPVFTDLRWRRETNRVDYYLFGAISLHIASIMDDEKYSGVNWKQTREEYLEFGLAYAEDQFRPYSKEEFKDRFQNPENYQIGRIDSGAKLNMNNFEGNYNSWKGYMEKGYSWQTRMWIDDMFMITALQMQAYQATKDDASYIGDDFPYGGNASANINQSQNCFLDRAVREMKLYIEDLPGDDGLYYHAPDAPFYWARGNGWMAVGMPLVLELIQDIPAYSEEADLLRTEYETMMASLLKFQLPTGGWAQLVDKSNYWEESSGSAMFAFAFITGVKNGWLDQEKYGAAARKAWEQLTGWYLAPNYDVKEVCEGTGAGDTAEHYYNAKRYPGDTHGQAAMMWCCYALTQLENDAVSANDGAAGIK